MFPASVSCIPVQTKVELLSFRRRPVAIFFRLLSFFIVQNPELNLRDDSCKFSCECDIWDADTVKKFRVFIQNYDKHVDISRIQYIFVERELRNSVLYI